MDDQDKKARFRAGFPKCAAAADAFRDAFGPGISLTYAEENGHKVGRPADDSRFTVISGADLVLRIKKAKQHAS